MFFYLFAVPIAVAFLATLFSIPYFLRFFNGIGIIGTDQQKVGKPVVASAGGMPVVFGFFLSSMIFIALNTFFFQNALKVDFFLAAVLSIFVISLIGFFDDMNVKKSVSKNASDSTDYRVGLPQWSKPLLVLPAAVPLMALSVGVSTLALPLIGNVDFGIFYSLLLVPIAIVCVSNATNMLAGLNGLEAGLMVVAGSTLGAFLISVGEFEAAAIALIGVASLLAFLFFNWAPARMLPGDSLTYFAGAVFASAVVIGNVEKFGMIIFAPWIAEAFLKLRGRFNVRSYGDLQPDGTVKAPYSKIYSLTHVVMKLPYWLKLRGGFTERQCATILIIGEAVLCAAALTFYLVIAKLLV